MEEDCCIVGRTSTPRFAKMVAWKYTHLPAAQVSEDLELHHKRSTSCCLIQTLSERVGELTGRHEFAFEYALPKLPAVVKYIAVSRDGTTVPVLEEGYREAMTGTISLYDATGTRMHTIYAACAPEYGKQIFDAVMDMELQKIKSLYPDVSYVGIADGAKDNWSYLENRTDTYVLDFYHACEHLSKVSVMMGRNEQQRKSWCGSACSDLKNKTNGAWFILRELKKLHKQKQEANEPIPGVLNETITYFENNLKRMNYVACQKKHIPIGSGVTEAACKVVVKQRICASGMKWQIGNIQNMLRMRSLILTQERWDQFWNTLTQKKCAWFYIKFRLHPVRSNSSIALMPQSVEEDYLKLDKLSQYFTPTYTTQNPITIREYAYLLKKLQKTFNEVVNYYLEIEKDRLSLDTNREFIYDFAVNLENKAIDYFVSDIQYYKTSRGGDKVNERTKNAIEYTILTAIREKDHKLFRKAETVIEKSFLPNREEFLFEMRSLFYQGIEDWNGYAKMVNQYMDEQTISDPKVLNDIAEQFQRNVNDKRMLKKAATWVEESIRIENEYYNNYTYALLLLRLKDTERAKSAAGNALYIADKRRDGTDTTPAQQLLDRINSR